jgi:hypothetical protein
MVNLGQVQNGIVKYLDAEITPKINGWQKWVFGALAGTAMSKTTNIFNALKQNEFVKMLDIIDENDMIDIDTLYREFLKQAQKGAITFDVPMIGAITLNSADVEKIYRYIMEGGNY